MIDFSNIKLVATDVDGTLANPQHQLSGEFYSLFQQLQELGILFVAASGRQYFNLIKTFERVKDDVIFVAENGGYVVQKDQELMVQPTDPDLVKRILKEAGSLPGTEVVLCGKKQAYIENDTPRFLEQVKMYYDKYELVESLEHVKDDDFLKIAICDFEGAERNSFQHFKQYRESMQVTVSGKIWLDIADKATNKGHAIEYLQSKFNIGPEETIAFGDYQNDIGMLGRAAFSYAVENAHPDVKAAAKYTTKNNSSLGVEEILKQVVEAQAPQQQL
ncbi:HAD family hydrolase [Pedobacter sp. SYSU D00535]|uniref:HAD family hydrolase n=1 Tax=Pedobacter sp. SYSU D00535 TaxID=2810308 RepID=UPI001A95AF04|nr:HAD family hydrolase [Pedobacter sp. SYSU D00535]